MGGILKYTYTTNMVLQCQLTLHYPFVYPKAGKMIIPHKCIDPNLNQLTLLWRPIFYPSKNLHSLSLILLFSKATWLSFEM